MKSTVSLLTFSIIFLISCNQNNKQEANNTVEKINIIPFLLKEFEIELISQYGT
jgi:hypothetical protein